MGVSHWLAVCLLVSICFFGAYFPVADLLGSAAGLAAGVAVGLFTAGPHVLTARDRRPSAAP